MSDTVRLSVNEGLARITLDRPERLNALNYALKDEIVHV